MNVVERGETRGAAVVTPTADPASAGATGAAIDTVREAVVADLEPKKRGNLRPLVALWPYVMRYRGQALAALGALLAAALATLAVPIAVRRMIDFGFSGESAALIDNYFAVMIGVVAVLALSSALRYYLVTTLGERIVADLRNDVFDHITALSASFFDRSKTGELISRLTADTTQIKAAVGASVSQALRNLVLFLGAADHDGDHQSAAVAVRAGGDSDDRAPIGRIRPRGAAGCRARRRIRSPRRRPMPPN